MLESHRQQPSGFMVVLMEMVPWIPSGSFFQRFSHENGWSCKNSGLVLWGKKRPFFMCENVILRGLVVLV